MDAYGPTPGAAQPASVAETHISVVTFVGDRAYKLNKPLDLGFLDHRTLAARRAACHREVMLNRRLSPDVYLGVLDVHGPDGAVCEHLVAMRRMPAERRLTRLLGTPEGPDAVRGVARAVAAFHATAARSPEIERAGSRDALLALWDQSLEQMRPFAGGVLPRDEFAEVAAMARRYLAGREPLFAARRDAGLVRDGHGDLLADDVFLLDDGPRILDCLAFSDALRWSDVLLDIAFLAMDIEWKGHPGLAALLLDRYRDFSNEHHPSTLWHHFVGYRAHVRSKVACLRAAQGDPAAASDAAGLHALAARRLREGRVRLVMVGGPPGTGKSTLAAALADRLGAVHLSTDALRKELAGLSPDADTAAPLGRGLYRPERVHRVYTALLARAETLLGMGEHVVLDASWGEEQERARARHVADNAGATLSELRCTAPPAVIRERMARRRAGAPAHASDASEVVAAALFAAADPWPSAEAVDTSGPGTAEAAARALEAISR
ncbi:MAG: AAA family ATPase [Thermoleophilia bacterium]|nr:AAA family ATPase [Thermoleophilia bacterium]